MTTARWAGVTYLFLIATGIFALAYAPGQFIVSGDAAATAAKIAERGFLFKSAVVAEMLCYASFVLLAVLLHRLFRATSETLTLLLFGFVLVSVAISCVAVGEKLAIVRLLAAGGAETDAISALLERYKSTVNLAELFWGLWLLPYGLLVLASRAIPRVFGVFLILGCCSYVAGVIVPLFWQDYFKSGIADIADIPGALGEIGGALWLAIMGAKIRAPLK